ncbi:MAG: L,D-transpeptidase family protein [Acidobacteriota bacterium]
MKVYDVSPTRRFASSRIWTRPLLLVVMLLCFPVATTTAAPTVPEALPAPRQPLPERAKLIAGTIWRDQSTLRAIERTAATHLPRPRLARRDHWRLVVSKSRYRLDLYDGRDHLKTYPIALGSYPLGDKVKMGDRRTPEGEFRLIPHHASPNYGNSFYVCYPSPVDAWRGAREGMLDVASWFAILTSHQQKDRPPHWTQLGGLILIHGTKDRGRRELTRGNWTHGCIALENDDLDELLGAFQPSDRPTIRIRP